MVVRRAMPLLHAGCPGDDADDSAAHHHNGRGHVEHVSGAERQDADADGGDGVVAGVDGGEGELEDGGHDEADRCGVEARQGPAVQLEAPAA